MGVFGPSAKGPGCIAWILLACQPLAKEVLVGKLVVVFACSAMVVGCSSVSVDCAPLISDGSRCVCPEGTVQVDDWVCELPDGGTLERPGRPDSGLYDSGDVPLDADVPDVYVAADGGQDASAELQDSGIDTTIPDVGVDAPMLLPDLAVECDPSESVEGAGDSVVVPFEVFNLGEERATSVVIRLEIRRLYPYGWIQLATDSLAVIDAGERRERAFSTTLPAFATGGRNMLRCIVDPAGDVEESDEENNIDDTTDVTATGSHDLVVVGPYPTTVTDRVPFSFRIENRGRVAVFPLWNVEYVLDARPSGMGWTSFDNYQYYVEDGTLPLVPAGGATSITINPAVSASGPGSLALSAGASSGDLTPSNNTVQRSGVQFVVP